MSRLKPAKIITRALSISQTPQLLGRHLEIAVIPLLGGAYLSAIVFSTWNAIVLYYRIPKEEAMLFQIPGYKRGLRT